MNKKWCPNCSLSIEDGWQYCPKCGKYIPPAKEKEQVQESEADILVKEAKQLYFKRAYGKAWEKCQRAADMDNGEAYFMLGLLTARRHNGYRNVKNAVTWYMKGCEKNNAAAINAIGVLHYKGEHVSKDIEKAISCFMKATDLGDMFAPYNLARCYMEGIGVPQDRAKAEKLLWIAIERDNKYAGDYYETEFFHKNTEEITPKEKDNSDDYVFSEEHFGYIERTYHHENATVTVLQPIFSADFYKKNAEFIKKHEEDYRRKCMYKLPELIIDSCDSKRGKR